MSSQIISITPLFGPAGAFRHIATGHFLNMFVLEIQALGKSVRRAPHGGTVAPQAGTRQQTGFGRPQDKPAGLSIS
jgi:hypothetical protein